jgi:hypothetical protein
MVGYVVYFNKTSKFTDFGFWVYYWHLISLTKHLAVAHSTYHNEGYYSFLFVIALVFDSSALLKYILVFVRFPGTIFTVEKP